jgi:hypothetical protein
MRKWDHVRYPELGNILKELGIPAIAFTSDSVSAFMHVAVDHYADILHATDQTKLITRVPVPKRLYRIAPSFAESIHTDITRVIARPPAYLADVQRSLTEDPTGATWLQRQIAIDEKIEPSTPFQKVMAQAAVTSARQFFLAQR